MSQQSATTLVFGILKSELHCCLLNFSLLAFLSCFSFTSSSSLYLTADLLTCKLEQSVCKGEDKVKKKKKNKKATSDYLSLSNSDYCKKLPVSNFDYSTKHY